jgi:hypothetical protein
MQATVHAILLIVLAVAALLSVSAVKRRVPTSRQFVVAFALTALGIVVAMGVSSHLCFEGNPRRQYLILGACLLLTLALTHSAAWRRTVSACVFVGMVGLSFHFVALVHTPGWTGNPAYDGGGEALLRSVQRQAVSVAADIENPDATIPEGWLCDLPVGDVLRATFEGRSLHRRQTRAVWHSPLTGIYRYDRVAQDFWYPGGPLREGVMKIEVRDRG